MKLEIGIIKPVHEQKVVILNNKKQKLVGTYYQNSSDTLMIFCHGTESFSQHLQLVEPFLKVYYAMGISLFLFDFTGYGESEGKGTFNHRQRVADIGSVLKYFERKYKKVILCGVSLGATCAIIAATKYKEVTKLFVINGYYDLRLTYPRFYLQTFLGYLLNHEIRKESLYVWKHLHPEKIKVPTIVVVGGNDQIVNPKQSIHFYNRLTCKKKLILIPGGDHILIDTKYVQEFSPEVKKWIFEE